MGHLVIYSLKEIKNVIIISISAFVLLGSLCMSGNANSLQIMKAYEMFLLPFVGCWAICGFWDYTTLEVQEVFLSYPKSRLTMGIGKNTCVMVIFLFLYSILFFYTFRGIEGNGVYYIGMCSEIFFWSFFGFFLIIKTQNIAISTSIIWIYTAIQILDIERYFEKISIYVYGCDSKESILCKGFILIILGSFFMIKGQKKLNKLCIST